MTDDVEGVLAQWREARPDLDVWPIAVVGRLMRLSRFWDGEIKRLLAEHDLEAGEFDVLSTLRRVGPPHELTPTEFRRTSLVTSGAITNRVDRMQRKGLVTRTRDSRDGRAVRICLTRRGLGLVDELLPLHLANEAALIEPLSDADQQELVHLLDVMLDPFEARRRS